jgi:hypothetical protein
MTVGVRCRQITEGDIDAVVTLLVGGFRKPSRQFWVGAFERLRKREPPPSFPKYGYLLESNGAAVGALLLICAAMHTSTATDIRCNSSSWYVKPQFRTYAALLVSRAPQHKDVTYVNVSPAPHTLPILEAQGFSRYCDGVFIALPLLSRFLGSESAKVLSASEQPEAAFDPRYQNLLRDHAAFGCTSVWCTTSEGAYPFVFRRRLIKRVIPCQQLIYCRDVADVVRFAAPLGRFFALRGAFLVMIDANAPIPGLVGNFFRNKMPKYFKGPQQPRLGDLAYTEIPMFGV